jgi:hypothetical protein
MNHVNDTPDCNMHEALVSYLYDEATAEEKNRFELHLAQCAACKRELASFHSVRDQLQQWQLDDLPVLRIEAARQTNSQRSFVELVKELFTVMPLWAKGAVAVATAMLVFAVMGTEVSIGKDGFSYRADIMRTEKNAVAPQPDLEQIRAELRTMVGTMIVESEQQQAETLRVKLVNLESQLQNMKSDDLTKLAANIQQQRERLRVLERDVDRRAGLDLTDILFSALAEDNDNGSRKDASN